MAGYFTSSRRTFKASDRETFTRNNGTVVKNTTTNKYPTSLRQVTTSYRTRGGGPKNLLQVDPLFVYERNLFDFAPFRDQTWDTGHPFSTYKQDFSCTHPKVFLRGRAGTSVKYEGPLVPRTAPFVANPAVSPTFNNLIERGTKAVRSTTPTNPVANVLTTLAEVRREGITAPGAGYASWLKSRTSILKGAGSEYLNIAFGWLPLISELNNTLQAVLKTTSVIEQLRRDSGQIVRRQFDFPEEVFNDYEEVSTGNAITTGLNATDESRFYRLSGSTPLSQGVLSHSTRKVTKTWFSGAYTYYLHLGDELWDKARRYEQYANKLLGITRLTPAVLWELTPWSWLTDWFVNFGDIVYNVSSFSGDGLVMRYGYVMQEVSESHFYTFSGMSFDSSSITSYSSTYTCVSKQRVKATPFGFGLNPETFSLRQWAILGALALSKSPNTIRGSF